MKKREFSKLNERALNLGKFANTNDFNSMFVTPFWSLSTAKEGGVGVNLLKWYSKP